MLTQHDIWFVGLAIQKSHKVSTKEEKQELILINHKFVQQCGLF